MTQPITQGFGFPSGMIFDEFVCCKAGIPDVFTRPNPIDANYRTVNHIRQSLVSTQNDTDMVYLLINLNTIRNSITTIPAQFVSIFVYEFEKPEKNHDYYLDCKSSGDIVPPMILIASGKAKAWFDFQVSAELHLEGAIGRLLHPISTPNLNNDYELQYPDSWTSEQHLLNAELFYCQEIEITQPNKYDVAILADGSRRYYNGTAWQTSRVPYIDPNDLEYAQLQQQIVSLTTSLNNTNKAVGTLSLHLTQAQTKIANLTISYTTLNEKLTATTLTLASHMATDVPRWNKVNELEQEFNSFKADVQGKQLGSPVNIETAAQGTGYTVTSTLGGRVNFTAVIILLAPWMQVSVNGSVVWSNDGLGLGTINDSIEVAQGDVITCAGMTSITFTPYEPKA